MKLGYERYAVDLKKELGYLKRQEDVTPAPAPCKKKNPTQRPSYLEEK
mgnify:CR=1 FL=1